VNLETLVVNSVLISDTVISVVSALTRIEFVIQRINEMNSFLDEASVQYVDQ
jgi:hypothetical protein